MAADAVRAGDVRRMGRSQRPHGRRGGVTARLLTADEAAHLLACPCRGCGESTRSAAMPAIPLCRYWRYDREDVLGWLESCKQPGRAVTLRAPR